MSVSTSSKSGSNCLGDFFRLFGFRGSEPRFEPRPALIDLPVLQKFKLYVTPSNFYLIGRDENKNFRRILKIDRRDENELNIYEDPKRYTKEEMRELKARMIAGNKDDGEFKAVTVCYGIIGFVKFLEPYYMLVITKRKKVGEICGHTIYGIAETRIITIPHPSIQTKVAKSKAEHKYKKLLSMVDLSKNFYFSYTYHLMYCLQKNIGNTERGNSHEETMFVWNAFLTREVRRILRNTIWTVALVYGFFQQTHCLVSGEEFVFTVIARRSRHYAGTRYLRRGVNDRGRVANDVETEQIVSKVVPVGQKIPITSVVQIRGSIPLFWSQETSVFNPQPEIILNDKDTIYEATQCHFKNLRQRYGKRLMILNLLKKGKKSHRETILRAEFLKAIEFINEKPSDENFLEAIHFDLSKRYKSIGADKAFDLLCTFARRALKVNDLFYCKAPSGVGVEGVFNDSYFDNPLPSQDEESSSPEKEALKADIFMYQKGVLRTNCVDCLDRTNFAQYAHGLVALAHQLRTLGISGPPVVDLKNPLARELMTAYQKMGDTIALQYGGSEAHSKMFDDLRGESNMVTRQRDLLIAMRRHYNNSYLDKEKQNAINVFLGHFRPQLGKPALWELDSDQYNIGRFTSNLDIENMRPLIQRSFSDNILVDGSLNLGELEPGNHQPSHEGGLNGNISGTNLDFPFYGTEPPSQSSVMGDEDFLRGTWSRQMLQGSSSTSDFHRPSDIPGFEHSYDTRFTPAEELYEPYSFKSWSSDNIFSDLDESATSLSTLNSSFNIFIRRDASDLIPGYSNTFSDWVFSEGQW